MKLSAFVVIGLVIAEAIFVPASTAPARAQSSGVWYYCAPARAYYPYVSTCPVPWREVAPNPNPYGQPEAQQPGTSTTAPRPALSAPVPLTPAPTVTTAPSQPETQTSAAFRQGQADRQSWETWFAGVTGDYRAGADYWAAHRSLPSPGSCSAAPPSTGADWTAGCFAAQQKLATVDVRRKTEPDYRLGWNSPPPVGAPLPAPTNSGEAPGAASPPGATTVTPSTPSAINTPIIPSSQKVPDEVANESMFIDATQSARTEFNAAANEMAQGGIRASRRKELCRALPTLQIKGWTGKVAKLSSNSDGLGVLAVSIGEKVTLETWNNALSDSSYHTLIAPDSDLFKTVSKMTEGDSVRFSGYFFPSDIDCVREGSLTLNGSMTDPEFIFHFDSVVDTNEVP